MRIQPLEDEDMHCSARQSESPGDAALPGAMPRRTFFLGAASVSSFALLAAAGAVVCRRRFASGHSAPLVRDFPIPLQLRYPPLACPLSAAEREALTDRLQLDDDADLADWLHWLRVFGRPGTPACRQAQAMAIVNELTSVNRLIRRFRRPAALVRTDAGARYLHKSSGRERDKEVEKPTHAFQMTELFAEMGLSATQPLDIDGRPANVGDLIRECMASAQTRKIPSVDFEWSVAALALYVSPGAPWCNRWGEPLSLDELTRFVLEIPVEKYCCLGTHMLSTFGIVAQAHRECPILTRPVERAIANECRRLAHTLQQTQSADGSWTGDWAGQHLPFKRQPWWPIHVTGHLLEAQLLLPAEWRIPPSCFEKAALYLANALRRVTTRDVRQNYCSHSHAAGVLLEWPT
jgi:hypothetical protein